MLGNADRGNSYGLSVCPSVCPSRSGVLSRKIKIRSSRCLLVPLIVQAFISTRLDYCNSLIYWVGDNLCRRLQAVQNAAARLITNTKRCEHITPSATLASGPPTCAIQDRGDGVQGTARPPACVSGGRLPTCVCHWTPTTAFVGHRHVHSEENQHTHTHTHTHTRASWRSLIRCCWTSSARLAYHGTVCQLSCDSRTLHSDNFNEHSKRIYLVSDSCSAE